MENLKLKVKPNIRYAKQGSFSDIISSLIDIQDSNTDTDMSPLGSRSFLKIEKNSKILNWNRSKIHYSAPDIIFKCNEYVIVRGYVTMSN